MRFNKAKKKKMPGGIATSAYRWGWQVSLAATVAPAVPVVRSQTRWGEHKRFHAHLDVSLSTRSHRGGSLA